MHFADRVASKTHSLLLCSRLETTYARLHKTVYTEGCLKLLHRQCNTMFDGWIMQFKVRASWVRSWGTRKLNPHKMFSLGWVEETTTLLKTSFLYLLFTFILPFLSDTCVAGLDISFISTTQQVEKANYCFNETSYCIWKICTDHSTVLPMFYLERLNFFFSRDKITCV